MLGAEPDMKTRHTWVNELRAAELAALVPIGLLPCVAYAFLSSLLCEEDLPLQFPSLEVRVVFLTFGENCFHFIFLFSCRKTKLWSVRLLLSMFD